MRLSADAILFGLRLMEEGVVSPAELAVHLRAGAQGGVPDQLVALQERVLAQSPDLAGLAASLGAEQPYVPLDCQGCRARLRARPEEIGPASYCPVCGEALVTARRLLFVGDYAAYAAYAEAGRPGPLRAAERPSSYRVGPVGQRFAHFELAGPLGRGGVGKVYEARNLRSGRTVALKVLDFRPLESSSAAFQKLLREARVASSVVHEHIVPVLDLGVAEGVCFIEMELVRGVSLREHVRQRGSLPTQEACRLCMEMLSGLAVVHGQKIVHRDIKPSNILIDEKQRARLTDFGLSRFLEETTSLSRSDKVVGSPHFMAPEQWRGDAVSVRTDLYAAGLVLHYALTGRLPYEGESPMALMYKHLHEPLLEPGEPHPFLPDYLVQVIRRATEKEPERRFESADEFRDALAAFLEGTVGQP